MLQKNMKNLPNKKPHVHMQIHKCNSSPVVKARSFVVCISGLIPDKLPLPFQLLWNNPSTYES